MHHKLMGMGPDIHKNLVFSISNVGNGFDPGWWLEGSRVIEVGVSVSS